MQKHRAAAAGDARPGVVVDLDDEIVEMIVAAQPVAGLARRRAGPAGCSGGQRDPRTRRRSGRSRRTGSAVAGRGSRSARHHSRSGRNVPRGVPPSPSRLLARIPPRPSATGITLAPALSQPRLGSPAAGRTRISVNVRDRRSSRSAVVGRSTDWRRPRSSAASTSKLHRACSSLAATVPICTTLPSATPLVERDRCCGSPLCRAAFRKPRQRTSNAQRPQDPDRG